MTEKCCRRCKYLKGENITHAGRICWGIPVTSSDMRPIIPTENLDTFYCQAFSPAERREAEQKQPPTQDEQTLTDQIEESTEKNVPIIRRRFV